MCLINIQILCNAQHPVYRRAGSDVCTHPHAPITVHMSRYMKPYRRLKLTSGLPFSPFAGTGSSPLLKWLALVSLHTVSFSQCAFKAAASQIEPSIFFRWRMSSFFLPNVQSLACPFHSFRFNPLIHWGVALHVGIYLWWSAWDFNFSRLTCTHQGILFFA